MPRPYEALAAAGTQPAARAAPLLAVRMAWALPPLAWLRHALEAALRGTMPPAVTAAPAAAEWPVTLTLPQ
jgi:hypothetical protein